MSDRLNSDLGESFQGSSLDDRVTEFNRLNRLMEQMNVEQFRDMWETHEECEGEINPRYKRFHHLVDDSDFNVNLANEFLSLCRSLLST